MGTVQILREAKARAWRPWALVAAYLVAGMSVWAVLADRSVVGVAGWTAVAGLIVTAAMTGLTRWQIDREIAHELSALRAGGR